MTEMNYIHVHCHLLETTRYCGERRHAFRLPLHVRARPRQRGNGMLVLYITGSVMSQSFLIFTVAVNSNVCPLVVGLVAVP